jgi:hypothetical protein
MGRAFPRFPQMVSRKLAGQVVKAIPVTPLSTNSQQSSQQQGLLAFKKYQKTTSLVACL